MQDVIERLRASKTEYLAAQTGEGKQHGREWAMLTASYDELRRIAPVQFGPEYNNVPYWQVVDEALGNEALTLGEGFWGELQDELKAEPSDDYVEAFVEGVQEVWEEVVDKLDVRATFTGSDEEAVKVKLSPYKETVKYFRTVVPVDGEERWFEKSRVTVVSRDETAVVLSMPKTYASRRRGISSLIQS